jgi:hypothetical protein
LDAPFAHPAGDSSRSKSALARATDGRVACVIRSLSRRLRCYQLQYEAQFFMRAIPPLLACKGFVRGPGCSPHGRGFFCAQLTRL